MGAHEHRSTGPLCYCGQRGCTETYISGGGLEKRYEEKFGVRRPLKEVERDYFAGEPKAVEFMQEFFNRFGRAIANLIDILDPDMIVLGGGVSNFTAVYTEGVAAVRKHVFTDELETPIREASTGGFGGGFGRGVGGDLKPGSFTNHLHPAEALLKENCLQRAVRHFGLHGKAVFTALLVALVLRWTRWRPARRCTNCSTRTRIPPSINARLRFSPMARWIQPALTLLPPCPRGH